MNDCPRQNPAYRLAHFFKLDSRVSRALGVFCRMLPGSVVDGPLRSLSGQGRLIGWLNYYEPLIT